MNKPKSTANTSMVYWCKPTTRAKTRLLIKIAKKINYTHRAKSPDIVYRGLDSLEQDLKAHCQRIGQDYRRVVESSSNTAAPSEIAIGNLDDGGDV